jgi:hypothetical protein
MIDEHKAGWHVLLGDEHIADLDWIGAEDLHFRYLFRLVSITSDVTKIAHALKSTALRAPDQRVILQNRASGAFLTDENFCADLRDDSTVGLRPLARAELPPFCDVIDIEE